MSITTSTNELKSAILEIGEDTMEATQTAAPSFESVWAALQEVAARQKETDRLLKETERAMKENAEREKENAEREKENTERLAQEQKKKNDEFYENLGHLTNLFGKLTEAMVAPKICEKFEEFGFSFPRANPNVRFNDKVNNISFEVDIMLENGDKAILIEVKTELTIGRIDKHIERLEKMRKYADLRGDKRTFLGAVAGIVITDDVRNYALNQGLYFIEYAGENFYITPPSGNPKEW